MFKKLIIILLISFVFTFTIKPITGFGIWYDTNPNSLCSGHSYIHGLRLELLTFVESSFQIELTNIFMNDYKTNYTSLAFIWESVKDNLEIGTGIVAYIDKQNNLVNPGLLTDIGIDLGILYLPLEIKLRNDLIYDTKIISNTSLCLLVYF